MRRKTPSAAPITANELPAELQRRESRLQRIREAKCALEARAKAEAAAGQPTESAKPIRRRNTTLPIRSRGS